MPENLFIGDQIIGDADQGVSVLKVSTAVGKGIIVQVGGEVVSHVVDSMSAQGIEPLVGMEEKIDAFPVVQPPDAPEIVRFPVVLHPDLYILSFSFVATVLNGKETFLDVRMLAVGQGVAAKIRLQVVAVGPVVLFNVVQRFLYDAPQSQIGQDDDLVQFDEGFLHLHISRRTMQRADRYGDRLVAQRAEDDLIRRMPDRNGEPVITFLIGHDAEGLISPQENGNVRDGLSGVQVGDLSGDYALGLNLAGYENWAQQQDTGKEADGRRVHGNGVF